MTIASDPFTGDIATLLMTDFLELNPEQRKVVTHDRGPLLVIAGPGSGKTHCLTLRAMNLLLLGKADPSELVLCTYTEKAAYEIQDRVSELAKRVGYHQDMTQMRIGTIHSICSLIIKENLHRIPNTHQQRPFIGNNYEIWIDYLNVCSSLDIWMRYVKPLRLFLPIFGEQVGTSRKSCSCTLIR